jgi:alpha-tubulin suppressor-like RCC1 family protein
MAYKSLNNAYSVLAVSISPSDLTLQVATGHGDRFPVIAGSDFTFITLEDAGSNIEIVKVTARATSSDIMTIERAQDGTIARSWAAGDIVELRLVSKLMNDALSHIDDADAAHEASAISFDNTGTSLAATNEQAAIVELDADRQENSTAISELENDLETLSSNTDSTLSSLATAISENATAISENETAISENATAISENSAAINTKLAISSKATEELAIEGENNTAYMTALTTKAAIDAIPSERLTVTKLDKDFDNENTYEFTGVLLSNGRLATWGRGFTAALGRGLAADVTFGAGYAAFNVPIPDGVSVKEYCNASGVGYVVLTNGWVYSCGVGATYGAHGQGDNTTYSVFTRVEFFVSNSISIDKIFVKSTRLTYNACVAFALSTTGEVYSCGTNTDGQLGRGDVANKNSFGHVSSSIPTVTDIAINGGSARSHTILLDENGDIWGAGYNGYGQLGLGDLTLRNTFVQISSFVSPVVKVKVTNGYNSTSPTAYGAHTLVLLANGDVYSTGYNSYGQLGLGDTVSKSSFNKITTLSNIVDIGAHGGHYGYSWAIDNDGKLYTWGQNAQGALGHGDTSVKNTPTLVNRWSGGVEAPPFEGKIAKIVGRSGLNVGVLILLDTDGSIYLAGTDAYGISNVAGNKNVFTPISPFTLKSSNEKIIDINLIGYDTRFCLQALSDKGNLYSSGANFFGCLSGNEFALGQAYTCLVSVDLGNVL